MPSNHPHQEQYVGPIYRIIRNQDDNYPYIHWSSHRNKPLDWEKLIGMFMGEVPLDTAYTSGVDIHLVTKGRTIDVVDCQLHLLISQRARVCLESLGLPGVAFIPVKINGERWWCLDVDRYVDALDRNRSTILYFDDSDDIMEVSKYVFIRDHLADPIIFRIFEKRIPGVFVTESVKQAVLKAGLVGFWFIDYENPPKGYLVC
ncbi:MAG: hypothetical protein GC164_14790 [Phycisphaera sp.]|nr:hypothetical protein [Phycisphaera sp.]